MIAGIQNGLQDGLNMLVGGGGVPSEESKAGSNEAKKDVVLEVPHAGQMVCNCAFSVTHDLKPQSYPLPADGLNHLNKCRWTCCGESWNCSECSNNEAKLKAKKGDSAEDAEAARAATEKVHTAKDTKAQKRMNPIPAYPGDDGVAELITDRKRRLAEQQKQQQQESGNGDVTVPSLDGTEASDAGFLGFFSALNPVPIIDATGNYIGAGANAIGAGAASLVGLLGENVILPVIAPVFGFDRAELDEAMGSLTDNVEKPEALNELLKKSAALYLELLGLRQSDQSLVEGWLREAVLSWVKVYGTGRPVVFVPLSAPENEDPLHLLISELDEEVSSDAARINAHLSLSATLSPTRHLTETVFFDWYVMCRHNDVRFSLPEFSGFPVLTPRHSSAVSRVLQSEPAVYALLKDRKTQLGFSFDDAIQWAVDTPETTGGCIAGDEECYSLFRELYVAVILRLDAAAQRVDLEGAGLRGDVWSHGGRYDASSVITGWQKLDRIFVRSLTLEGSRSIKGFALPALSNRATRVAVERLLREAFSQPKVEEAFRGAAYETHEQDTPKAVIGSALQACGGERDWPYGRGSVYSPAQRSAMQHSISCVVNEVDHLKIAVHCDCSTEVAVPLMLRDYAGVLDRIEDAIHETHGHTYMRDETFGYITSLPENCGSALRVTAVVRLPFLSQPVHDLPDVARRLGMQATRVDLGKSDSWSLTNLYTLGASESEIVQGVVDGLATLISIEQCLNSNDPNGARALIATLPETYCVPSIEVPESTVPVAPKKYEGDIVVQVTDDVPLFTARHKSVASEVLRKDPAAYYNLISKTTAAGGWSISDALRSAIDVPESRVGILLGGEHAYAAFEKLIIPVLAKLHLNASRLPFNALEDVHYNDLSTLEVGGLNALDPLHMLRFRIEISRNIRGLPGSPCISRKLRRKVEYLLYSSISSIKKREIDGKYYSLRDLESNPDGAVANQLAVRGLLPFCPPFGDARRAGGMSRDWPDARGVFVGTEGKMVMHLNTDDHLKLIYECDGTSQGISDVMHRFSTNLFALEDALLTAGLTFVHSERLGYLTSCPSLLGNAMIVQVELLLPRLTRFPSEIYIVCKLFNLIAEPFSDSKWLITSRACLGQSEVEQIQQVIDGALTIIRAEKEIPDNKTLDGEAGESASSIYASVLRYLKENPSGCDELFGIKEDVTRTPYPAAALTLAMHECGVASVEGGDGSSCTVFRGDTMSIMTESGEKDKYIWIDPFTRTLHWSSKSYHDKSHSCVKLVDIRRVQLGGFSRAALVTGPRPMSFTLHLQDETKMPIEMNADLSEEAQLAWARALLFFVHDKPVLDPLFYDVDDI